MGRRRLGRERAVADAFRGATRRSRRRSPRERGVRRSSARAAPRRAARAGRPRRPRCPAGRSPPPPRRARGPRQPRPPRRHAGAQPGSAQSVEHAPHEPVRPELALREEPERLVDRGTEEERIGQRVVRDHDRRADRDSLAPSTSSRQRRSTGAATSRTSLVEPHSSGASSAGSRAPTRAVSARAAHPTGGVHEIDGQERVVLRDHPRPLDQPDVRAGRACLPQHVVEPGPPCPVPNDRRPEEARSGPTISTASSTSSLNSASAPSRSFVPRLTTTTGASLASALSSSIPSVGPADGAPIRHPGSSSSRYRSIPTFSESPTRTARLRSGGCRRAVIARRQGATAIATAMTSARVRRMGRRRRGGEEGDVDTAAAIDVPREPRALRSDLGERTAPTS